MTSAVTPQTRSPFATVEEAIEDIRQGKFVVVVDAKYVERLVASK
jgi:3,4-dihydroxy-2-butanone 4-phosphate synthase